MKPKIKFVSPSSPDDLDDLEPGELRIEFASTTAVDDLEPEMSTIIAAIKEVCGNIASVWVSDRSCFTDLRPRDMPRAEYEQRLSEALRLQLNLNDPNDNFIVKFARRMRITPTGTS